MAEYQLLESPNHVVRTADGARIPFDLGNQDWLAYTVWLAQEGNVPDPYVVPPPTADDIRDAALLADTDRQTTLNAIRNATPAQIKTFVTNNVTDLASARVMITRIMLLLAHVVKQ